jgi:serine/threonine protein kinase
MCIVTNFGGENLGNILEKKRYSKCFFNCIDIKRILYQIIYSLSYLHDDLKIVHGDIKPGNILIKMFILLIFNVIYLLNELINNYINIILICVHIYIILILEKTNFHMFV